MIGRVLVRVVAVASIAVCVVVALVDALRGWPSGGFYAIDGAVAIAPTSVAVWLRAGRIER